MLNNSNDNSMAQIIENYAKARDANYPQGLQYIDVIRQISSTRIRTAVLGLYAWLHFIDDIVDSNIDTQSKLYQLDEAVRILTKIHDSKGALDPELATRGDFVFWNALAEAWSIIPFPHSHEYLTYLEIMKEIACRPYSIPFFQNNEELERFNLRFFGSIVGIMAPAIFLDIVKSSQFSRYEFCKHAFIRFMLGMQMINLAMDIDEDNSVGQNWIPASLHYNEKLDHTNIKAVESLYEKGIEYMDESICLRNQNVVGHDAAQFFTGLNKIFIDLGQHLLFQSQT